MPRFTVISNGCEAGNYYKHLQIEYPNPLMFSLFLQDNDYIKFCRDFDKYIDVEPLFTNTPISPYHKGMRYPVMQLDDIEIHWIHASSANIVAEKWHRRRKRYKNGNYTPVFLFSPMQNYTQSGRREMMKEYCQIKHAYFYTSDEKQIGETVLYKSKDKPFEFIHTLLKSLDYGYN